jgi:hypothetical protein
MYKKELKTSEERIKETRMKNPFRIIADKSKEE